MRRVVITGMGAVTPLGNDVESTWRAAIDGRSGASQLGGECHRVAATHVHQHMNLIEQIRRGRNVEPRGAPRLRRRAGAELAHDADHFVPVSRSRRIVSVSRPPVS